MVLESIKELGVIDIAQTNEGQTEATVSYFEYDLAGPVSALNKVPDEIAISPNTFLNPFDENPTTVEMKMIGKHEHIKLEEETIVLPEDRDPGAYIMDKVLEKTVEKMLELAEKHRTELGSLKNGPFDLKIIQESETDVSIARKIFAKILSCGNSIATSSRRGPADVVIASTKMINMFNIWSSRGYMSIPTYKVASMNVVACDDLGDTIVVFRRESGLVLCSREELLPLKYLFNENGTDVKAANVMYAVVDVGTRVHYNYLSFKVTIV